MACPRGKARRKGYTRRDGTRVKATCVRKPKRGRRNAPTTRQRRKMGSKLMSLPWAQASQLYKKRHKSLTGVGGYPMDTRGRAISARGYAIKELNQGYLTMKDVKTIFRRTGNKYRGLPKLESVICTRTGKRKKCRSVTAA